MPSLADRLKNLGVSVGSGAAESKPPSRPVPIDQVVQGEYRGAVGAQAYEVTETHAPDTIHGDSMLSLEQIPAIIAAWGRIPGAEDIPIDKFLFIDTETSGLAASSGTVAFLIGAGRFVDEQFVLKQFFLPGPSGEVTQLQRLEEFADGVEVIVSFNGKAFDMPLLRARFITRRLEYPWDETMQLDLLHMARRIWRYRLPDRSLGYLEEHVLGVRRTGEDTPGWMIPDLYFDYLKTGDSRPLKGVFYHNAIDILSLVTLLQKMNEMLTVPEERIDFAEDLLAVARIYQDFGSVDQSVCLFEQCLEGEMAEDLLQYGRREFSLLLKRLDRREDALSLWWQAAADRELYAYEELAKFYEHHARDIEEALRWTDSALALLQSRESGPGLRLQWEEDFLHRQQRLQRKQDIS